MNFYTTKLQEELLHERYIKNKIESKNKKYTWYAYTDIPEIIFIIKDNNIYFDFEDEKNIVSKNKELIEKIYKIDNDFIEEFNNLMKETNYIKVIFYIKKGLNYIKDIDIYPCKVIDLNNNKEYYYENIDCYSL